VQSAPVTTKVVSSNPTHGMVYLIQHYMITEILLKLALNIITLTLISLYKDIYLWDKAIWYEEDVVLNIDSLYNKPS
jgi:hypothetical protein